MKIKYMRHLPDGFVVGYSELLEGNRDFQAFEVEKGENPHDPKFLSDTDKGATDDDEFVKVPARKTPKPKKAAEAAGDAAATGGDGDDETLKLPE